MQLFYSAVKAAGQLISQMLTRMRLRSPKLCICFCVSGCKWLFKPQENQPELNKTRHSHPSQSLPIAADDRQNADTTLLSNWILDIIYSCFNMSGKSCGNNTQSLTFVLVLACVPSVLADRWMNEEAKCDLIQILRFLCHMRTGKHQYTEKCTINSVWKPISCIHYSLLPPWLCLSNGSCTPF